MKLRNLCPVCHQAPIFRGLLMNVSCPSCRTVFARESGYFLGAMVLSYFASSSVGIILMLILFAGLRWEIIPAAVTAVGVVLLLTPILYRTSRLLWIHIDHAADPSQKPKNSL